MGKSSKEFVSDALKKVVFFAFLVVGSTASQQQGCCPPIDPQNTGGSGGAGGTGSGEMPGPCFDYAGFDGMTPTVTFQADVLPIFRKSCGFDSTCHGSQMGPPGQPYLGPALGPSISTGQIDQIFLENVNAPSAKASAMKIIEPGKPETSFLMHKMDDTLKCAAVTCDVDCGVSMPKALPILTPMDRDLVRRWIAQGALKN